MNTILNEVMRMSKEKEIETKLEFCRCYKCYNNDHGICGYVGIEIRNSGKCGMYENYRKAWRRLRLSEGE